VPTSWGTALIGFDGRNVTSLRPPTTDGPGGSARGVVRAVDADAPPVVQELAGRLVEYLAGHPLELATRAEVERWLTAAGVVGFRRDLSLTLFEVPRGVTLAYGELAALAGRPGAARAAGTACARNPLPVIIPCHRVVHAGARRGDVGSYGAATGSDYKRRLLELEDAALVRVAHPGT
ncbi:MAG: Methylated-DNA--protein-cysteine methyltransferase, partial [Thermoleophilia bacterium]|nr:Methylated-DNA--protein-cysteine methyltransferase [Thermoleophilia bacterium]